MGSKELYATAEVWKKFGKIEEFDMRSLGDVNGDGKVTVADVVMANNIVLEDKYDAIADMNGDGEVSVADVLMIVNLVLTDED